MPLTARSLANDWAAAVAHCQAPVISIEVTELDPYTTTVSLYDAIDAKFLALIDDLIEMHPAGLRRRTPLRAMYNVDKLNVPAGAGHWLDPAAPSSGQFITNTEPITLTRQGDSFIGEWEGWTVRVGP